MNAIENQLAKTEISGPLLDRFLRYVRIWTTSDVKKADEGIMPSTEIQRDMAHLLASELKELGLRDVEVTSAAYVVGRLPPSEGCENVPAVGFLAHMDTVGEVSGKDVEPVVHEKYDGSPVVLKDGVRLDPAADIDLKNSVTDTIITSDGTTLLGADDKAGIAVIMTALAYLKDHPEIKHGPIETVFSPDEETGHGMDKVPLDRLTAKACYTLDGGQAGELEAECFNAWKTDIAFTGVSRHTGTARPDMVNAVTMAAAFIGLLPRSESPETTDGYMGFYAPMEISGHIEQSQVTLYLRDFDAAGMKRRLETVECIAAAVEKAFPGGRASVTAAKQYLNMKETLDRHPEVTGILVTAVKNVGLEPRFRPIRGGTDGSRLTELGIPTPNVFTGGHNFHSKNEWASLAQMVWAAETVIELAKLWSAK